MDDIPDLSYTYVSTFYKHVLHTCSWFSFLWDLYFLCTCSTWRHAEDICPGQCTWIYLSLCNHNITVQGMGEL